MFLLSHVFESKLLRDSVSLEEQTIGGQEILSSDEECVGSNMCCGGRPSLLCPCDMCTVL